MCDREKESGVVCCSFNETQEGKREQRPKYREKVSVCSDLAALMLLEVTLKNRG